MHSWFSINITDNSNNILDGFFSVNSKNIITEFYETINGNTINKNILLPIDKISKYKQFKLYYNTITNNIGSNSEYYDNAFDYDNEWNQFDFYGVLITRISYFPQYDDNHKYNYIRLHATSYGTEIMNTGSITFSSPYNDAIYGNNIDTSFDIMPLQLIPSNFESHDLSFKWFTIIIKNISDSSIIFNGIFSVDSKKIVTGFYEIIDDIISDINLLIPSKKGTFNDYIISNVTSNDFRIKASDSPVIWTLDNAFISSWNQFDSSGIVITEMSYFPQNKNYINLCAINANDQIITNNGSMLLFFLTEYELNVTYKIKKSSDPFPKICYNNERKLACIFNDYEKDISINSLQKGNILKTKNKGNFKIINIDKNYILNKPCNITKSGKYNYIDLVLNYKIKGTNKKIKITNKKDKK